MPQIQKESHNDSISKIIRQPFFISPGERKIQIMCVQNVFVVTFYILPEASLLARIAQEYTHTYTFMLNDNMYH